MNENNTHWGDLVEAIYTNMAIYHCIVSLVQFVWKATLGSLTVAMVTKGILSLTFFKFVYWGDQRLKTALSYF